MNLFVALFASSCTIFALLIAFCSLCCGGKIWGGGNVGSTGVSRAGSFVASGGDGGCGGGGDGGCGGSGGGGGGGC